MTTVQAQPKVKPDYRESCPACGKRDYLHAHLDRLCRWCRWCVAKAHKAKVNGRAAEGPFIVVQNSPRASVPPVAIFRARYEGRKKGFNVEEARANAHRFAGCMCS